MGQVSQQEDILNRQNELTNIIEEVRGWEIKSGDLAALTAFRDRILTQCKYLETLYGDLLETYEHPKSELAKNNVNQRLEIARLKTESDKQKLKAKPKSQLEIALDATKPWKGTGAVKFYNKSKEYGYIEHKGGNKDVRINSKILSKGQVLANNTLVEFEAENSARPMATRIWVLKR